MDGYSTAVFIKLFVAGLAFLAMTVLAGKLLQRLITGLGPGLSITFGFALVCFLVACFHTTGNTSLWATIILIGSVAWLGKTENLETLSVRTPVAYLFLLFIGFFGLAVGFMLFNNPGSITISNYDSPFYARLTEFLIYGQRESYMLDFINPEQEGVRIYHYVEQWATVFVKQMCPDVPTILCMELVAYPLLFTISAYGFLFFLVEHTGSVSKKHMLLAPLVAFGLAFPYLNEFLPEWIPFNSNRSWSPIEQPKIAVIYLFLPWIFLAAGRKNLKMLWILSVMMTINYITTLPATIGALVLVSALVIWKEKRSWLKEGKTILLILLAGIMPFVVWLWINHVPELETNPRDMGLIVQYFQGNFINVLIVSIISLVLIFILSFPLLTQIRVLKTEQWLLTGLLVFGGLVAYALLGFEMESFQLFQNVAFPALNILFVAIASYVILEGGPKWIRVYAIILVVGIMFSRFWYHGYELATKTEMAQLSEFIEEETAVTAFLRHPNEYKSVHMKTPNLEWPIEQLQATHPGYHSLSINELSWKIAPGLYQKNEADFKTQSSFYLYAKQNGLLDTKDVPRVQRSFLRENSVKYLEASPWADVNSLGITLTDSIVFSSGERIFSIEIPPE